MGRLHVVLSHHRVHVAAWEAAESRSCLVLFVFSRLSLSNCQTTFLNHSGLAFWLAFTSTTKPDNTAPVFPSAFARLVSTTFTAYRVMSLEVIAGKIGSVSPAAKNTPSLSY